MLTVLLTAASASEKDIYLALSGAAVDLASPSGYAFARASRTQAPFLCRMKNDEEFIFYVLR